MASGFNLTAQLNLKGPTNVSVIVADIKKQLGNINASVNISVAPAAAKNIAQLNAILQSFNQTLTVTATSATATAQAFKNLASAIGAINSANLPQTLNSATNATNKLAQASANNVKQLSASTTEMTEFGKQSGLAIRRFAAFSTVTGVVYGLTNAINNGIRSYIDYDRQLVKLQQVTGQSAAGLKGLENTITSLSTGLGVGSAELTEVSSTLAQAGLSARDTEKALSALALSSLAPSFDSMNETVEGSIALMRQFGINAGDLEKALGSVNSVAAKFAVEAADLITAIQRTGGVFATASKGVSEGTDALNEFLAVFTSIRATTRESAETIATGLRTIFTRIQRGDTIQALKEYGVNLQDLDGKFVGAYKAVELLSKGLSTLDPRDVRFSKIIEELGGFRQIGKVIPLIQQFATAQDALKVAQTGQGSLTADAAKAQQALAVQISKVREEFLALFREIGQSDSFQAIAKGALSVTSALIKAADSIKGVLPVLGVMLAFKGASAAVQFGSGFLSGVRGSGGAKGFGNRMGGGPGGMNSGGEIRRFAAGGLIPGSGDTDSVDIKATPGEFMMSKPAVKAIGVDNLYALNRNRGGIIPKKYYSGGVAGLEKLSPGESSNKIVDYIDFNEIDNTSKSTKSIKKNKPSKKSRKELYGFQLKDNASSEITRIPINEKEIERTLSSNDSFKDYINSRADKYAKGRKNQFFTSQGLAFEDFLFQKVLDRKGYKPAPSKTYPLDFIPKIAGLPPVEAKFTYDQVPDAYILNKRLRYNLIRNKKETIAPLTRKEQPDNIQLGPTVVYEMESGLKDKIFSPNATKSTKLQRQERFDNKLSKIKNAGLPLNTGGTIQRFGIGGKSVRRKTIIDSDKFRNIKDPEEAAKVAEGMKLLGATTEGDYAIKLSALAGQLRESGGIKRFSVMAGAAGNRKTSLAMGRGTNDNAKLREVRRKFALHPSDLDDADEVMSLTTTLKQSKLDYMGKADRIYSKDSSTDSEQKLVKLFTEQRNTTKDSTLLNRATGTTENLSPDYGEQTASLLSQFGSAHEKGSKKGKVVVLGEKTDKSGNPLYQTRIKRGEELPELVRAQAMTSMAASPFTKGHSEAVIGTMLEKAREKNPKATLKDLLVQLAPDLSLSGGSQGMEHGSRYGIFPAAFRRELIKSVHPDIMVSSADRPSDTGINPRIAEIEKGLSGRRRFAVADQGAPVIISKAPHENPEGVMARYSEAGLTPYNIARSADSKGDSISGTDVRKSIIDKNYDKLDRAVLPQVSTALKVNQPQIKNRSLMVPLVQQSIGNFVQSNKDRIKQQTDKILAGASGGPFTRMTPKFKEAHPDLVKQIQQLKKQRDSFEKEAYGDPAHDLMRKMSSSYPDIYGLNPKRQKPVDMSVSTDDIKKHIIDSSKSSSFFKSGLSFSPSNQQVDTPSPLLQAIKQSVSSTPAPIKTKANTTGVFPKGSGDLPTDSKTIASFLKGTSIPSDPRYGSFAGKTVDIDMVKKVWRKSYAQMSEEKTTSYAAVKELLSNRFSAKPMNTGGEIQRFGIGGSTDAISTYKATSMKLNRSLMLGTPLTKEEQKNVKDLKKQTTDKLPKQLYSGIGENRLSLIKKQVGEKLQESAGKTFSLPGFLSTSLDSSIAMEFARQGLLSILTNPKKKGINTNKRVSTDYDLEKEFILPPNSKFKILSAKQEQSSARPGSSLTRSKASLNVQQLASGGSIQRFMAGELVRRTKKERLTKITLDDAAKLSSSQIITGLTTGQTGPVIVEGMDVSMMRTILGKRNTTPDIQRKKNEILRAYTRRINGEVVQLRGITDQKQAAGLLFGVAGLYGSPFNPTDMVVGDKGGLTKPTTVQVMGGVPRKELMDKAGISIDDLDAYGKDFRKSVKKGAKRLLASDILSQLGLGKALYADFDKTLVFGADNLPDLQSFNNKRLVGRQLLSKKARLSVLGEKLRDLLLLKPQLSPYVNVLTARPPATVGLLQAFLKRKNLNIPTSQFTGVGGENLTEAAIGKLKAAQLPSGSVFVDDNGINTTEAKLKSKELRAQGQAGIKVFRYKNARNPLDKPGEDTAAGLAFQESLRGLLPEKRAMAAFSETGGKSIDFPLGLGKRAALFGLKPNIPTDAKRTLSGPSTAKDNITNYLKSKGYNDGGTVQKFETGGAASSLKQYQLRSKDLHSAVISNTPDKAKTNQIKDLDGSMIDSLPKILYSGFKENRRKIIDQDIDPNKDYKSQLMNKTFSFPSFLSTSINYDSAKRFAGSNGGVLHIRPTGKGANVLERTGNKGKSALYDMEAEYLLPRNSRFKINRVLETSGPLGWRSDWGAPNFLEAEVQNFKNGGNIRRFADAGVVSAPKLIQRGAFKYSLADIIKAGFTEAQFMEQIPVPGGYGEQWKIGGFGEGSIPMPPYLQPYKAPPSAVQEKVGAAIINRQSRIADAVMKDGRTVRDYEGRTSDEKHWRKNRGYNLGGLIQKFVNAGKVSRKVDPDKEFMKDPTPSPFATAKAPTPDFDSLEKTSGLKPWRFRDAVRFAKDARLTLPEFRNHLEKLREEDQRKLGLKTDTEALRKSLMIGTPETTKKQELLAKELGGDPDYQYRPILTESERIAADRARVRSSALKDIRKATGLAGGGQPEDTVRALVSNGEAYVPPELAKSIGYGKLHQMNQADRNGMDKFSRGGISVFRGPGSGTSDSIGPISLPVGSFILREKATKALGFASGGSVQRFASGGTPIPVRPENISSTSIAAPISEIEELRKSLDKLGDKASEVAKLMAKNGQISYASVIKAGEADVKRLQYSGASIAEIVQAEQTLAQVRANSSKTTSDRQFLEAGFKESKVGKTFGSGAAQQRILEESKEKEKLIQSQKEKKLEQTLGTGPGGMLGASKEEIQARAKELASTPEEKIKTKNQALLSATQQVTGVNKKDLAAKGISGDNIQQYISQSMMDRKTLSQMDKELIRLRRQEYDDNKTFQGIRVASAKEAENLMQQELAERRKTATLAAKAQGLSGPGMAGYTGKGTFGGAFGGIGNRIASGVANGVRETASGIYNRGLVGNTLAIGGGIRNIGASVGGQAGFMASMGLGMIAGQGEHIAGAFTNDKKSKAGIGAGIEAGVGTAAAGLGLASSVAMIPGIGPFAAAAVLATTAVTALTEGFRAADKGTREFEQNLRTKKIEDSGERLGKATEALQKNPSDENSRNKVILEAKNQAALIGADNAQRLKDAQAEKAGTQSMYSYITGGKAPTLNDNEIKDLAKQRAKASEQPAQAARMAIESQMDSGKSFSKIVEDPGFKELAGIIAETSPEFQAAKMRIEEMSDGAVAFTGKTRDQLIAQKRQVEITKLESDAGFLAQSKTKEAARAMDEANKAGRKLSMTFDSMAKSFDQALGRLSYELDSMANSTDSAIDALNGQAKIDKVKSKDVNVLQNPDAYDEKTKQETSKRMADFIVRPNEAGLDPLEQRRRQQEANKVEKLLNSDTDKVGRRAVGAVAGVVTKNRSAPLDVAAAEAKTQLESDIKDLPKQVQSQILSKFEAIKKEVGATTGLQPEQKTDLFAQKLQDELGNAASEAAGKVKKMGIEAASFKADSMNRFIDSVNRAASAQIKATELLNKAKDTRTESDVALREATSGGKIGLGERQKIVNNRVGRLTGGEIDPTKISKNIEKQTAQRSALQNVINDESRDDKDRMKAAASLKNLDSSINRNQQALEELANSTDMASAAMDQLQNVQKMQADRLANIDQILTSTPQELQKFNESLVRVQQRAMGINPGPSREARKAYDMTLRQTGGNRFLAMQAGNAQMTQDRATDLKTMEQYKSTYKLSLQNQVNPQTGKKYSEEESEKKFQREAANARGQMAFESGAIRIPGLAQGIMSAVDPNLDPARKDAEQTYKSSVAGQAAAQEELSRLKLVEANLSLLDATNLLGKAFKDLPNYFNNIQNNKAKDLEDVRIKVAEKPIGASTGRYINFKPQGTDTVPAMLTPGEFVINARATAQHLPLLTAINNGTNLVGNTAKMSTGGIVYLAGGGRPNLDRINIENRRLREQDMAATEKAGAELRAREAQEEALGTYKTIYRNAPAPAPVGGFGAPDPFVDRVRENVTAMGKEGRGAQLSSPYGLSAINSQRFYDSQGNRKAERSFDQVRENNQDDVAAGRKLAGKDTRGTYESILAQVNARNFPNGAPGKEVVAPQEAAKIKSEERRQEISATPASKTTSDQPMAMPSIPVPAGESRADEAIRKLRDLNLGDGGSKKESQATDSGSDIPKTEISESKPTPRKSGNKQEPEDFASVVLGKNANAPQTIFGGSGKPEAGLPLFLRSGGSNFPKPRNMAEVQMYKEGLSRGMTIQQVKNERQQAYRGRSSSGSNNSIVSPIFGNQSTRGKAPKRSSSVPQGSQTISGLNDFKPLLLGVSEPKSTPIAITETAGAKYDREREKELKEKGYSSKRRRIIVPPKEQAKVIKEEVKQIQSTTTIVPETTKSEPGVATSTKPAVDTPTKPVVATSTKPAVDTTAQISSNSETSEKEANTNTALADAKREQRVQEQTNQLKAAGINPDNNETITKLRKSGMSTTQIIEFDRNQQAGKIKTEISGLEAEIARLQSKQKPGFLGLGKVDKSAEIKQLTLKMLSEQSKLESVRTGPVTLSAKEKAVTAKNRAEIATVKANSKDTRTFSEKYLGLNAQAGLQTAGEQIAGGIAAAELGVNSALDAMGRPANDRLKPDANRVAVNQILVNKAGQNVGKGVEFARNEVPGAAFVMDGLEGSSKIAIGGTRMVGAGIGAGIGAASNGLGYTTFGNTLLEASQNEMKRGFFGMGTGVLEMAKATGDYGGNILNSATGGKYGGKNLGTQVLGDHVTKLNQGLDKLYEEKIEHARKHGGDTTAMLVQGADAVGAVAADLALGDVALGAGFKAASKVVKPIGKGIKKVVKTGTDILSDFRKEADLSLFTPKGLKQAGSEIGADLKELGSGFRQMPDKMGNALIPGKRSAFHRKQTEAIMKDVQDTVLKEKKAASKETRRIAQERKSEQYIQRDRDLINANSRLNIIDSVTPTDMVMPKGTKSPLPLPNKGYSQEYWDTLPRDLQKKILITNGGGKYKYADKTMRESQAIASEAMSQAKTKALKQMADEKATRTTIVGSQPKPNLTPNESFVAQVVQQQGTTTAPQVQKAIADKAAQGSIDSGKVPVAKNKSPKQPRTSGGGGNLLSIDQMTFFEKLRTPEGLASLTERANKNRKSIARFNQGGLVYASGGSLIPQVSPPGKDIVDVSNIENNERVFSSYSDRINSSGTSPISDSAIVSDKVGTPKPKITYNSTRINGSIKNISAKMAQGKEVQDIRGIELSENQVAKINNLYPESKDPTIPALDKILDKQSFSKASDSISNITNNISNVVKGINKQTELVGSIGTSENKELLAKMSPQNISASINTSPQYKAGGGIVYASNGTLVAARSVGTDTVPAMLTPGEFVVNRQASQQHMPILQAINSGAYNQGGVVKYLAEGGIVAPQYYKIGGLAGLAGLAGGALSAMNGMDMSAVMALANSLAQIKDTFGSLDNFKAIGETLKGSVETMKAVVGSFGEHISNFPAQLAVKTMQEVTQKTHHTGLGDIGQQLLSQAAANSEVISNHSSSSVVYGYHKTNESAMAANPDSIMGRVGAMS